MPSSRQNSPALARNNAATSVGRLASTLFDAASGKIGAALSEIVIYGDRPGQPPNCDCIHASAL
jgi:hypothetical protein